MGECNTILSAKTMYSIAPTSSICKWGKGNSFPNIKILDLSKLKPLADDKSIIIHKMWFAFGRVENSGGKGEKAGYQHLSPFPQMFSKAFYLTILKPFSNKPLFLHVCSTSLLTTL